MSPSTSSGWDAVRLEPLYTVRFAYPEHYFSRGPDTLGLFFAEGRCEGQVTGASAGSTTPACAVTTSTLPTSTGSSRPTTGRLLTFHLRGLARKSDYGRK